MSQDAAPWVPPGYSGGSSSSQSATPPSEPATGISAAKVFTAVADPPVRSLPQSEQTESDQAPPQTGRSHGSQEVQERPEAGSQEAEVPPAKSEEAPAKQEEDPPASNVEHSSEVSNSDEPAKASEPAPSNGRKATGKLGWHLFCILYCFPAFQLTELKLLPQSAYEFRSEIFVTAGESLRSRTQYDILG